MSPSGNDQGRGEQQNKMRSGMRGLGSHQTIYFRIAGIYRHQSVQLWRKTQNCLEYWTKSVYFQSPFGSMCETFLESSLWKMRAIFAIAPPFSNEIVLILFFFILISVKWFCKYSFRYSIIFCLFWSRNKFG